ncbi:hypothetical protein ADUPG1_009465, partial [Aduncisulcus paluster]
MPLKDKTHNSVVYVSSEGGTESIDPLFLRKGGKWEGPLKSSDPKVLNLDSTMVKMEDIHGKSDLGMLEKFLEDSYYISFNKLFFKFRSPHSIKSLCICLKGTDNQPRDLYFKFVSLVGKSIRRKCYFPRIERFEYEWYYIPIDIDYVESFSIECLLSHNATLMCDINGFRIVLSDEECHSKLVKYKKTIKDRAKRARKTTITNADNIPPFSDKSVVNYNKKTIFSGKYAFYSSEVDVLPFLQGIGRLYFYNLFVTLPHPSILDSLFIYIDKYANYPHLFDIYLYFDDKSSISYEIELSDVSQRNEWHLIDFKLYDPSSSDISQKRIISIEIRCIESIKGTHWCELHNFRLSTLPLPLPSCSLPMSHKEEPQVIDASSQLQASPHLVDASRGNEMAQECYREHGHLTERSSQSQIYKPLRSKHPKKGSTITNPTTALSS